MLKKLNFLLALMFVFFSSFTASVFAGPIDKLKDEMKSDTAEGIGWGILTPALKIIAIVFFVLGMIAIIVAVGYLLLRGIKMIFGKGELGKREIGRAFTVLLIGILVSGGSWIGLVDLGNRVLIEPVNNQIIEDKDGNTKQDSKEDSSDNEQPKKDTTSTKKSQDKKEE